MRKAILIFLIKIRTLYKFNKICIRSFGTLNLTDTVVDEQGIELHCYFYHQNAILYQKKQFLYNLKSREREKKPRRR